MSDANNLLEAAKTEITGMAKDGMGHPSTKPVLIGMGVGAIAGALLPFVSLPAGLLVGGSLALYNRIKR